jgi:hypothetical protein
VRQNEHGEMIRGQAQAIQKPRGDTTTYRLPILSGLASLPA